MFQNQVDVIESVAALQLPQASLKNPKVSLDENGNITEDQFFTSPSAAAMFVVGKNANGLTSWRNKDKVTLRDLEEKASEEATE